jgi:hypothetical protein
MKNALFTIWFATAATPLFAQTVVPPVPAPAAAAPSAPAPRTPPTPIVQTSPVLRGLPLPTILPVPVVIPVARPAPVPIYRPTPATQPTVDQVPASQAPPVASTVALSGPRFGVSVLSDGVVHALADKEISVKPTISQFGWQFERQFFSRQDSGVTALNEWVGLLGGLDQGVVIPSLTWLVGVRTKDGAEFGLGPNFTPAGAALAISAGVTIRSGIMNIPMNFAIVPTKAGVRVTLLTGFTLRSR